MPKGLIIVLLLLAFFSANAQKLNKEKRIKVMHKLIEEYSPDISYMIRTRKSLPREYRINGMLVSAGRHQAAETWLTGKTEKEIAANLSLVAHESSHGFQFIYPFSVLEESYSEDFQLNDYTAYFIDSTSTYIVKHTECFNSNELKNEIPKPLKTFRYTPYIAPKAGIGSQKSGIYGLLGEFNAYYIGMKISYDLFAYYKAQASNNLDAYQEYIQNTSSDVAAFYEFKYFMLKYLIRAKNEYPNQFQSLLQNSELRKAYTQAYLAYERLVLNFEKQLNEIEITISNLGISAYMDDEYFWVDGYGVGLNLETINPLKEELSKQIYSKIHQEFIYNR